MYDRIGAVGIKGGFRPPGNVQAATVLSCCFRKEVVRMRKKHRGRRKMGRKKRLARRKRRKQRGK